MKSLDTYIFEKLKIRKDTNKVFYVTDEESFEEYMAKQYDSNDKHLNLQNISFEMYDNSDKPLYQQSLIHKYVGHFIYKHNVNTVDVSNWEFGNYNSLSELFNSCYYLTDIIGLDTWDVSNIKTMNGLFKGCTKLKDLSDIKNWDVSSCNNFSQMFDNCSVLSELDLSSWTLPNKMSHIKEMFSRCFKLEKLKGLENWNVEHATYPEAMFVGCKLLKELNLSKWKLKPRSTERMFCNCNSLETIGDVSKWDLSDNINTTDMFNGCKNLILDMSMLTMNVSVTKVRMFKDANKKIKKPKITA